MAIALSLGGVSGGEKQTSSDGEQLGEWHLIVAQEDCNFSVLNIEDALGNIIDKTTEVDSLLKDGIISTKDLTGSILKYQKTNSERSQVAPEVDKTLCDSAGFILEDSAGFILLSA
jgi:hypothetical protein